MYTFTKRTSKTFWKVIPFFIISRMNVVRIDEEYIYSNSQ